ncbi:MAG: cytochrome bc complex cytochrome b subunit, partial [Methylococcaceae bacterium]|nr:cytochrome bc complex cytochrome b subunit [Methylococcaceae bacterium]
MSRWISRISDWIFIRLPVDKVWKEHLSEYFAPKNFNFWYYFGSLALLVLVNQLVTGIVLAMSYKPDAKLAFDSIEYIMRDVDWGWLVRYMHSTGASAFFIVVYLHMFRGLLYGSFKKPRELVWILGMLIYFCLMAESFMGYLLPWGQMSYWGAQVIISLFGAIPYFGEDLALWIRGDYVVSDATLNRFFAFHVIAIPLALVALVYLHIVALRQVGSNNPDGLEIKQNKDSRGNPVDGIPFHPYYTVKDLVGAAVFLIGFAVIIFYTPELGGLFLEPENFIPANSLTTPEFIVPLWYFTPFYSILRAIPDKFGGVLTMAGSIFVLFILPWLDRSNIKSIRYRGKIFRVALAIFVVSFVSLGYLGTQPATPVATIFARMFTLFYFAFFLLMPWYTQNERPEREIPERVTCDPPLNETLKKNWLRIKLTFLEISVIHEVKTGS